MSNQKPKISYKDIEIYNKDSKYFDNKQSRNIDKSFFIQTDYNTGTKYRVPLKEVNNDEYMSNPNLHYIAQENARFDYNYLYYIKEKFGQYDIHNIVNFENQNYCPASIMNYRTFDPVPTITESQRRNFPCDYCSSPIIFWAPLSNIYNKYNIEQGRYWISTSGKIYDIKSDRYLYLYKETIPDTAMYTWYKSYNYCVLVTTDYNYGTWGYVSDYNYKTKKLPALIRCRMEELVLYTFAYFPGCEQYMIRHKNGRYSDDRIENLEWVTSEEYNDVKS